MLTIYFRFLCEIVIWLRKLFEAIRYEDGRISQNDHFWNPLKTKIESEKSQIYMECIKSSIN